MKKLIATLLFVTATFNYGAHGNSGQMGICLYKDLLRMRTIKT